jgi:predicted porin
LPHVIKLTYRFDKIPVDHEYSSSTNHLVAYFLEIYMQFKRLAVALVVSAPMLAAAQSNVTVYGTMDAAVGVLDTGANGEKSQTVINSGNQSSSRLGFRGTEDLGNGLKALFNVEAGLALDTGVGDSALFGRRSVVGLQGAFGTVTVGREYTPISFIAAGSDIFGQGFYGSNLSAFNSNRLTRRVSNSINYKTTQMSGFTGSASFSAGERTVEPSGDLMGVALEYANGGLFLGAGYQVLERLAAGDDKEYAFGAGYKFGTVEVKGNFLVGDQVGNNNKFEQANIGAAMTFGAGKAFVNVQQNKFENGAKGNGFAIAYSYSLSKRTNVYTSYASMRNNGLATFGLNSSSTNVTPVATALGADPTAFTVGVRHTF